MFMVVGVQGKFFDLIGGILGFGLESAVMGLRFAVWG